MLFQLLSISDKSESWWYIQVYHKQVEKITVKY